MKVQSRLNAYLNNAQFLEFNLAHPVLARREVRQAIVRAALGRVGVRLDLVDGDLGTYSKRIYQDRGFDININGLSTLFDPTVGFPTGGPREGGPAVARVGHGRWPVLS